MNTKNTIENAARETGHTPGPWEYDDQCGSVWSPGFDIQIAHCMSQPGVGMLHDMAEVRANARLIASVPELLDALQNMVDLLVGLGSPLAKGTFANDAREAIAKATGNLGWLNPVSEESEIASLRQQLAEKDALLADALAALRWAISLVNHSDYKAHVSHLPSCPNCEMLRQSRAVLARGKEGK